MLIKRACVVTVGVFALTIALVGCGSTSGSPGAATSASGSSGSSGSGKGGFKLAVQAPLSGQFSFQGLAYEAAFKDAIGWQNRQGGVGGHTVSVTYSDDRADPTAAASTYRQLAQGGNLAVFGLSDSDEDAAVQPAVAAAGVPVFGETQAPFGNLAYNDGPDLADELTAELPLLKYLATKSGTAGKRVVLLYLTTPAGELAYKSAKTALTQAGYDVVGSESISVSPPITTFDTSSAQIKGWKPDYILAALDPGSAEIVMPSLRNEGVTVPVLNFWAGSGPSLLAKLKDPNFYVYRVYADPAETSTAAKTMDQHAAAQGLPSGTSFLSGFYYTQGYVQALMALNVLKACGAGCTPAKFNTLAQGAASHNVSQGLTAPGEGYSSSSRYFVNGANYYVWSPSKNSETPIAVPTS